MIFLLPFVLIIVLLIALYLQYEELHNQHKIVEELRKGFQSPKTENNQHNIGVHSFAAEETTKPETTTATTENTPIPLPEIESEYQRLLEEFRQSVNRASLQMEQNYQKAIEDSKLHHTKFMHDIEQNILTNQTQNLTQMSDKVNQVLLKFEQNLADFLSKAENQSLESINLELRSARQLIDTYKSQQFSIIDENIIAVLERTISLVLKEKLTLKDQLDLVHESLERAKLEKFFA